MISEKEFVIRTLLIKAWEINYKTEPENLIFCLGMQMENFPIENVIHSLSKRKTEAYFLISCVLVTIYKVLKEEIN